MLCPKCGTANPDTSEQCFNCGRILTEGADAPGAGPTVPHWGEEPVPEWLLDLQKGLPEELRDPTLERTFRQETAIEPRLERPSTRDKRGKPIIVEEVPAEVRTESEEWLSTVLDSMRSDFAAPEEPESAATYVQEPVVNNNDEDWLEAFISSSTAGIPQEPESAQSDVPSTEGAPEDDWLHEKPEEEVAEPVSDGAESVEEAGPEIPDWLARHAVEPVQPFDQEQETLPFQSVEAQLAESAAHADQEIPDWLARHVAGPSRPSEQEQETALFKSVEPPTASEAPTEPAEEPAQPATEPATAEGISADTTVWIKPVPADADMPEWLLDLKASGDVPPSEEDRPDEDENYEEMEVPDWLRGSEMAPPPPEDIVPEASPEPQAEADEEAEIMLPTEIFGPVPEQLSADTEENVPEWLRDSLEEAHDELSSSPAIEAETSAPTADFETTTAIPLAQTRPGEEPAETSDAPEWLRQLRAQETIEGTQPPSWLTETEDELESDLPEAEIPQVMEETPSWLMGIAPVADAEEIEADFPLPEGEEIPDWLQDPNYVPEEISEEPLEIGETEVPAWLKQMGSPVTLDEEAEELEAGEQTSVSDQPAAEATVSFEAAQDEPGISTEAMPAISTQGPRAGGLQTVPLKEGTILAGLGAALTPRVDPSLLTSEQQVAPEAPAENLEHASVFQEIVSQPLIPREPILGRRGARWWNTLGRIFLYLLIIAVVGVTLYWQGAQDIGFFHEYNMPISPRTESVHAQINAVPERSTVLLIADYDPGLAEELNAQAYTLLQSLIDRNLKVLMVSTTFAGPQVMQNIVEDLVQGQAKSYKYGEDYINLGYLPGQEASLKLFGQNPLAAVHVDFLERKDLSTYGSLTASLSEAAEKGLGQAIPLVVYLGGNEESLRVWIEQVLAQKADMRMIVGVSAGLEPYAHPYLESGQLAGMLSGLTGAAEYESLTKNPGRAVRSIDSQVSVHLLIVGLIVLGNIVYFLGRIFRRR